MKRYMAKTTKTIFCGMVFLATQLVWSAPSRAQIVALGASVVEGRGVSAAEAFPQQLEAMLRAKGKPYSVSNQGISGDTTGGVLARLDSAVPQGTRIVILLIGGNDVRRGASVEDAKRGSNEITARLQARKIRVINAWPYYLAARNKGMVVGATQNKRGKVKSDDVHLNAEGNKYMAAQLLSLIN